MQPLTSMPRAILRAEWSVPKKQMQAALVCVRVEARRWRCRVTIRAPAASGRCRERRYQKHCRRF
jgi:hypothetical protein